MSSNATVLLLHPAGYDARFWTTAVPLFEQGFDVLAPNRPGHGSHIDELRLRRSNARTAEEYRALLAENRTDTTEIEWLDALVQSDIDPRDTCVVGSSDAGILALKLAARLPIRAIVLVETAVLLPADTSLETILARLEASELDHQGLADVMTRVLATKDPAPYVDWAMSQPGMAALPTANRSLVEAMIADNIIPALFTGSGHAPGDVGPEQLATITGPVLNLHTDPSPEPDRALESLLTSTILVQETVPATPPIFPLSAPQDFVDRVFRFLADQT